MELRTARPHDRDQLFAMFDHIVATGQGFPDAPPFNLVFESNPARSLYEGLGWRQIGVVPRGVENEPAVIYWRDVP